MPRGTSFQGTHQTSAMCRCSSESNKHFKSTHTGILTEMWSQPCCCLPQSFWATRRQTHGTTPVFLHTPMLPPMLRRTSTFPGICQTEDVQDHDDFFVPIVVPPERQWPRRVCDVYCPQIGELCIRVLLFYVFQLSAIATRSRWIFSHPSKARDFTSNPVSAIIWSLWSMSSKSSSYSSSFCGGTFPAAPNYSVITNTQRYLMK